MILLTGTLPFKDFDSVYVGREWYGRLGVKGDWSREGWRRDRLSRHSGVSGGTTKLLPRVDSGTRGEQKRGCMGRPKGKWRRFREESLVGQSGQKGPVRLTWKGDKVKGSTVENGGLYKLPRYKQTSFRADWSYILGTLFSERRDGNRVWPTSFL